MSSKKFNVDVDALTAKLVRPQYLEATGLERGREVRAAGPNLAQLARGREAYAFAFAGGTYSEAFVVIVRGRLNGFPVFLGDGQAATDILSQTYLDLHQFHAEQGARDLKAVTSTFAFRRCADAARKRSRRPREIELDAVAANRASAASYRTGVVPSLEDTVVEADEQARRDQEHAARVDLVDLLVGGLADRPREFCSLSKENYSDDEIAALMTKTRRPCDSGKDPLDANSVQTFRGTAALEFRVMLLVQGGGPFGDDTTGKLAALVQRAIDGDDLAELTSKKEKNDKGVAKRLATFLMGMED